MVLHEAHAVETTHKLGANAASGPQDWKNKLKRDKAKLKALMAWAEARAHGNANALLMLFMSAPGKIEVKENGKKKTYDIENNVFTLKAMQKEDRIGFTSSAMNLLSDITSKISEMTQMIAQGGSGKDGHFTKAEWHHFEALRSNGGSGIGADVRKLVQSGAMSRSQATQLIGHGGAFNIEPGSLLGVFSNKKIGGNGELNIAHDKYMKSGGTYAKDVQNANTSGEQNVNSLSSTMHSRLQMEQNDWQKEMSASKQIFSELIKQISTSVRNFHQ